MNETTPITRASPSLVNALHECGLRVALSRRGNGIGSGTPWTRLGTICHTVYEAAARGELGTGDDFRDNFEFVWATAVSVEEAEVLSDPIQRGWGRAQSWPGYSLKRARLRRRAFELASEVDAWKDPLLRVEEVLAPEGDLFFGTPDLVIRRPPPYRIIDYKTGAISDDSGDLKSSYRRQLLLYAHLERSMPDGGEAEIVEVRPLNGGPVSITVDWDEVAAVVDEARNLVEAFNEYRLEPEVLANPSISSCGHCPFANSCAVMWSDPPEGLDSAQGIVTAVDQNARDTVSFTLEDVHGSTGIGTLRFLGFSKVQVPVLSNIRLGDEVRIVGFRICEGEVVSARPRGWVRAAVGPFESRS